ncbi:MAG: hypothetical protein IKX74_06545 [Erysipelotrichaceae bacterium]|nr:hypothetical protein [Erysipelotrichaceae bacterium]
MKSKWKSLARLAILFFAIVLFFNALALFTEIRRDISYGNRSYGLSDLDEAFSNGEYHRVYVYTVTNEYAEDQLQVDASQYEAFGRYYHAYVLSRLYDNNAEYLKQMETEKQKISWKKITSVIDMLETQR